MTFLSNLVTTLTVRTKRRLLKWSGHECPPARYGRGLTWHATRPTVFRMGENGGMVNLMTGDTLQLGFSGDKEQGFDVEAESIGEGVVLKIRAFDPRPRIEVEVQEPDNPQARPFTWLDDPETAELHDPYSGYVDEHQCTDCSLNVGYWMDTDDDGRAVGGFRGYGYRVTVHSPDYTQHERLCEDCYIELPDDMRIDEVWDKKPEGAQ